MKLRKELHCLMWSIMLCTTKLPSVQGSGEGGSGAGSLTNTTIAAEETTSMMIPTGPFASTTIGIINTMTTVTQTEPSDTTIATDENNATTINPTGPFASTTIGINTTMTTVTSKEPLPNATTTANVQNETTAPLIRTEPSDTTIATDEGSGSTTIPTEPLPNATTTGNVAHGTTTPLLRTERSDTTIATDENNASTTIPSEPSGTTIATGEDNTSTLIPTEPSATTTANVLNETTTLLIRTEPFVRTTIGVNTTITTVSQTEPHVYTTAAMTETTFTELSTEPSDTTIEFSGFGSTVVTTEPASTTRLVTSEFTTITEFSQSETTTNFTSENNSSHNTTMLNTTAQPTAGTTFQNTTILSTAVQPTIEYNTTFESTATAETIISTTETVVQNSTTGNTTYETTSANITFQNTPSPNTTVQPATEYITTFESTATVETFISTTTITATCNDTCPSQCNKNRRCECIDEICTEVCPNCGDNSECVSLQCQCISGYTPTQNGRQDCVDIDECNYTTVCNEVGQSCLNSPGSYQCICQSGYAPSPNGSLSCVVNTCDSSHCGTNAGCFESSKQCACFVGYTGDPSSNAGCSDIDECLSLSVDCTDAEVCINTNGSYYCDCIPGYVKSRDGCVPITCETVDIPCSSKASLCNSASNNLTNITFPATLGGYSAKSSTVCGDSTANAGISLGSRSCSLDGSWGTVTWLSSCEESLSTVASQPIDNEQSRQEVSASLELLTSNPETVDSSDVTSTTEAIENVTNSATNISAPTATSVVTTISNVMESPGLDESGQSAQLLAQLDMVASLVVLGVGERYQAVSNNVSVFVTQNDNTQTGVGLTMFVRPNTSSIGFRSDQFNISYSPTSSGSVADGGQRVQSSIYIPGKALSNSSKASFYVFGNANLFNSDAAGASPTSSDDPVPQPSTVIISATVENQTITDLPADSLLKYSLPLVFNETQETPFCVYWKEDEEVWKNDGCKVTQGTSNSTDVLDCSCNHLTNFAALLRPIQSSEKALDIITIVGCSISSCSLILLVLLFLCLPKTRSGRKFQASFLLLNLSLALLGLNLTFLISEMPFISTPENYDDIKSSCIAIAVFLHFFLLSSCAWMNCEGALLFLAVIKPLYTRTRLLNKTVVIGSVSWGWVMPVIFVGIVAGVDYTVYQYPYDENFEVTCWIEPSYIIYLAVIPTAIMIGANLIVYVILTYYLCRNPQTGWGKTWRSTRESHRRKLGINVSILMLLGMTWIFGFFLAGIENETAALVFAYIFTIFNSLQGFFLLLLYILRNKEARLTVRKEISSIYDKFALSSTSSRDAQRGRRYSTGFTDAQSHRYPGSTDPPASTDDFTPWSSMRRRPQNDGSSEVVSNWRSIENDQA